MAADEHTQNTLDRLLTGLRGPLEAALRANGDQAADEVRRLAQDQLAQLRAAARKQNDDLRASAEAQIAELKRMLDDIRRTAQQQIDSARHTLDSEIAAGRSRAQAEIEDVQRMSQSQVEDVQRAMDERLQALNRELSDTRTLLEAARHQAEAARHEADAARQAAARLPERSPLYDDLRTLDEAASLSDLLESALQAAARQAGRAALLMVKDDRLREWQAIGFAGRLAGGRLDVAMEHAGLAATVVRERRAARGTAMAAFGGDADAAAALPVTVGGAVVAVLYAEAPRGGAASRQWQDDLEALARYASRVLESLTVQQATGVRPVRPGARASYPGAVHPRSGGLS